MQFLELASDGDQSSCTAMQMLLVMFYKVTQVFEGDFCFQAVTYIYGFCVCKYLPVFSKGMSEMQSDLV